MRRCKAGVTTGITKPFIYRAYSYDLSPYHGTAVPPLGQNGGVTGRWICLSSGYIYA